MVSIYKKQEVTILSIDKCKSKNYYKIHNKTI